MSKKNNKRENGQKPVIIIFIDSNSKSETAFRYACQIAKKSDFALQISAVIEPAIGVLFASKAIGKGQHQNISKKMEQFAKKITEISGIIPIISIREGQIVNEIINEISQNPNCIMIVFGKSSNVESDNSVIPKITKQVGKKIQKISNLKDEREKVSQEYKESNEVY